MPRRSQKASTEITAADRKAKAVDLRARGYTFAQIADALGYSHASAASKAFHAALRERPAQNVDQLRAEAATRYEYLLAESVRQIDDPGPRVSAIGKVAVYPPGHPKAGQIVEDGSIRARGIDNARKVIGDYVRLTGAAPAAPGLTLSEDQVRQMASVLIAQRDLDARAPRPPLQLPTGYGSMSPQEQMRADLDARRAALHAQRAAIAEADVVDAEVVEDE